MDTSLRQLKKSEQRINPISQKEIGGAAPRDLLPATLISIASTGYLYITAIFGSFSLIYSAVIILAGGLILLRIPVLVDRRLMPAILFGFCLLPALLAAGSTPYSDSKLAGLAIAFILVLLPSASRNIMVLSRTTQTIGALACAVVCILLVRDGVDQGNGQITLEALNVIHTGRAVGFLVIILALFILTYRKNPFLVILAIIGLVASVIMLLSVGSRGPALAAVLALVSVGLVSAANSGRRVVLFGLACAVVTLGATYYLSSSTLRVFGFDDNGRYELYRGAIQFAIDNPLGAGWGNFSPAVTAAFEWPHNIFLELAVEGGWIAIAGFVGLLIVAIGRAWRTAKSGFTATRLFPLAFLVFSLINAQFSGDISGNSILWSSIGFALLEWEAENPHPCRRNASRQK